MTDEINTHCTVGHGIYYMANYAHIGDQILSVSKIHYYQLLCSFLLLSLIFLPISIPVSTPYRYASAIISAILITSGCIFSSETYLMRFLHSCSFIMVKLFLILDFVPQYIDFLIRIDITLVIQTKLNHNDVQRRVIQFSGSL